MPPDGTNLLFCYLSLMPIPGTANSTVRLITRRNNLAGIASLSDSKLTSYYLQTAVKQFLTDINTEIFSRSW
jgi:hypothetical protein